MALGIMSYWVIWHWALCHIGYFGIGHYVTWGILALDNMTLGIVICNRERYVPPTKEHMKNEIMYLKVSNTILYYNIIRKFLLQEMKFFALFLCTGF